MCSLSICFTTLFCGARRDYGAVSAVPTQLSARLLDYDGCVAFVRALVGVLIFVSTEADWLQGPYVYALYMVYGFTKDEIAALFVAGFLSSMLFGTFVGSLADKLYVPKKTYNVLHLC